VTLSHVAAAESPLHRRVVFLLAPPRSGAEVVRDALAVVPGVRTIDEPTHLFDEVLLRIWASSKLEGRDGIGRLASEDELLPAGRQLADSILIDGMQPDERLVEYTPDHAMVTGVIAAVYPDASFVAVARDGRAVTQDLVRGPHRRHRWAVVAARQWADAQRAIATGATTHQLRFEALTASPEDQLTQLAAAIGLPMSALDLERAAASVRAAAPAYATDAGLAAAAAAEAAGSDELAGLGYGGPRPGVAAQVLRRAWRATLPRGATLPRRPR
jgi:hypothetical protein